MGTVRICCGHYIGVQHQKELTSNNSDTPAEIIRYPGSRWRIWYSDWATNWVTRDSKIISGSDKTFSFLLKVYNVGAGARGATQLPIQWVPVFFSSFKAAGFVNLTTNSHLIPRQRMSGAIPLLLVCAFMLWTGTTVSLNPYD